MKIAFLYHWNEDKNSGVQRKVRSQVGEWSKLGHTVRRIIVCAQENAELVQDEGQEVFTYSNSVERFTVWDTVCQSVQDWQADCVYHRYDLPTPGLMRLASYTPMFLEINSNDVHEYRLQGRGRALLNDLSRRKFINHAAGLVFVTRELSEAHEFAFYQGPRQVLPNGIDLASQEVLPVTEGGSLRFVLMGTAGQSWQGFDKVVEFAKHVPEAHFDIIGTDGVKEGWTNSDNLHLHGYLTKEKYRPILERATVAFGSLALHRKSMQEAAPLKVREYLASGLPVVLAYEDSDFPTDQDFILRLPNTENNLLPHRQQILDFARRWQGSRVARDAVAHLDYARKERERLNFMESHLSLVNRRVVLLTTGLDFGGAERQVVALAGELRARGWDMHVVSMRTPRQFVPDLSARGVHVHSLDMQPGRATPESLKKWLSLVSDLRPAVVHSHMIHANLLGRTTRVLAPDLPIISTAHNMDEGGGWRNHAYRWTDWAASLTTNVSEAATEEYRRKGLVPSGRIRTMPNGLDIQVFRRSEAERRATRMSLGLGDEFVWLCVGRFAEAKDHQNLIRAFAGVSQSAPDSVLLLAGDGPLRKQTEFLCRVYGVEERVRFLGNRSDIPALMSAADGYVMSSAWEGLPMVLLEAAACELPLVATDVGGNGEVASASPTNRLVPPQDSAALAEAMRQTMSLPRANLRETGKQNRAHVEANFALASVVDRWEATYEALLDRRERH